MFLHPNPEQTPNDEQALNVPTKFRVGRPRINWMRDTLQHIWYKWSWCGGFDQHTKFNFRDQTRLEFLEGLAIDRLFSERATSFS